jgi:multimeric flavodoxin WrbA
MNKQGGNRVEKKILIVLGSPRRKGNSAILAEQFFQGAKDKGVEADTVYLNGLEIKPCQGCNKCIAEGAVGCYIDDDMNKMFSKVKEADTIVIASPVYWFNITAQTKLFIDRLYSVAMRDKKMFRGKNLVIILTYGGDDVFDSGAINAIRSFQDMCRYVGANVRGIIYGSASAAGEIRNNRELMEKAYSLGSRIASYQLK